MYSKARKPVVKRLLLLLPTLIILPVIVLFDTAVYFFTRPSCLNCSNLLEFLQNASLTVFLLTSMGYQLKRKK